MTAAVIRAVCSLEQCHELQGLAPHHDDVEIFVCQTEGSKRWRLYKPQKGFHLPNQPSGDLKEEDLSEPILDVTLKVQQLCGGP